MESSYLYRFHWTCGSCCKSFCFHPKKLVEPKDPASPWKPHRLPAVFGEEVEQLGNQVLPFQLLIMWWFQVFPKTLCMWFVSDFARTYSHFGIVCYHLFLGLLRWRLKAQSLIQRISCFVSWRPPPSANKPCQNSLGYRIPSDQGRRLIRAGMKKRCPTEKFKWKKVHGSLRKTKHSWPEFNGINLCFFRRKHSWKAFEYNNLIMFGWNRIVCIEKTSRSWRNFWGVLFWWFQQ